jgi:large subunit ribosomal protein L21
MYAVIETGGKQYRVEVGTVLEIEKLEVEAGASITLDHVLLVADGEEAAIGRPLVADATVSAKVLRQARGDKVISFKYRPKARRRVKKGHRQDLTILRVSDITFNGRSAADAARASEEAAKTERERLEEAAARQAAADAALAAKLAAKRPAAPEPAIPAPRGRRAKPAAAEAKAAGTKAKAAETTEARTSKAAETKAKAAETKAKAAETKAKATETKAKAAKASETTEKPKRRTTKKDG